MTAEPIKLTLPYPPTTNHLYITVMKNGRPIRVPSTESKRFKTEVGKICQIARVRPFIGEVVIELVVYRPRRVGDLDGTFKCLIDSLSGHAWADDKQIVELHAYRRDDKFKPRVEIEIKPIGLF